MGAGKYRLRTAVRERLPEWLTGLAPKGKKDCGNHEWYLSEPGTWRCYHDEVGVTHEIPWDDREFEARRLEGAAMNVRAGITTQDRLPAHY
jgi:hypothetical protein